MVSEKLLKTRFALDTVANGRKSMTRVIRLYHKGEITGEEAKMLRHLMTGLLDWFKLETDLRIEERLEAIEKVLEKR